MSQGGDIMLRLGRGGQSRARMSRGFTGDMLSKTGLLNIP